MNHVTESQTFLRLGIGLLIPVVSGCQAAGTSGSGGSPSEADAEQAVAGNTLVQSTFSDDDEAWTVDGLIPNWNPSGGRSGGYLSSFREDSFEFFFWLSPPKFTGDFSAAYDGTIQFSIRDSNPTTRLKDSGNSAVQLVGAGFTIRARITANANADSWTTFSFPLNPAGGWLTSAAGEPDNAATAETIQQVLADLVEVKIRAQWGQQLEGSTAGLDEVRITGP